MKTVNIIIWKFKEKLHEGQYQFETDGEVRNYALGLYNGFDLCGKEPTGYETEVLSAFHNGDLSMDIDKIESFDVPITVAKSFDPNLDYPFGLDVEDTSYWYAEQKERDEDFDTLKKMMPKFSFVEI